jgi:site-specific DNA-methyltransferase (adenine-specific)
MEILPGAVKTIHVVRTTQSSAVVKQNVVFSSSRTLIQPPFTLPPGFVVNVAQQMDGLALLQAIGPNAVPLVFFDPQYRSLLDRQNYGNEGVLRQRERAQLQQMDTGAIGGFVREISRILMPSGHCMLWADTFIILGQGVDVYLEGTSFAKVDMICWDEMRMGMGYRSRQVGEYLVVLQKPQCVLRGYGLTTEFRASGPRRSQSSRLAHWLCTRSRLDCNNA